MMYLCQIIHIFNIYDQLKQIINDNNIDIIHIYHGDYYKFI